MRETILKHWLQDILNTHEFTYTALAGDASFRQYYRVFVKDLQYVLMDAPPPENPKLFAEISKILATQGLCVPHVIHANFTEGFLLLSDLGDLLYLHALNQNSADQLYRHAITALLNMQPIKATLPIFDRDFLYYQIGIFENWYLGKHKAIQDITSIKNALTPIYELLVNTIEQQPKVFVHRDFHSRNLMVMENDGPGILDFQDAMMGPITYDLVSLLQDCYITWPRDAVVAWVLEFQSRASELGLLPRTVSTPEFIRWFDWTGLHRHLKNLGIFARLYHRDGKPQYLTYIPQIHQYILETSHHYPELYPLKNLLQPFNDESTFGIQSQSKTGTTV